MRFPPSLKLCLVTLAALNFPIHSPAQSSLTSPSNSSQHKGAPATGSAIEPGSVTNGLYRNKSLALSCKVPPGWVLRTDELNLRDEKSAEKKEGDEKKEEDKKDEAQPTAASSAGARVLLAAFSRPPDVRAEDVNSSILITAENAGAYPGLTEAAQYFFPLTEVFKAQGFIPDEDPYEIAIGAKTLPRADFHKNVGSRVMHQSTLAMLSHGYAISITVIAGTDDEVEDLIDGLSFTGPGK